MCGIAGIISSEGLDPKVLMSMTHLVKHRGPDGYGFVFFGSGRDSPHEVIHNEDRLPSLQNPTVGLGHRRLAILDLSALGNQPMQTEDGVLWITYNGEIYNYLEIRQELKGLGHSFKTGTDTEVILHAYQEWGSECLSRFNGMWSFALWDRLRQRLFCSRDRFGVKPFYYYVGKNCFLFGSEIKQILQWPEVRRVANDRVVFHYLEQGLLDHSVQTFFEEVYQLPGGHFLTLDVATGSPVMQIHRYWELPIAQNNYMSDAEACEQFLAKFTRSVTLRMRSDVPVGSCLSGGLDSSSVVCLATRMVPSDNFHTFSSCFEDRVFDEREYIAEVVTATHVKSHLVFPTPQQFWQSFERLIWHQDEPVGGLGIYAQWCVMEAARREGIPVLLDGQGGDETLCGYQKFYYIYLWHLLKSGRPRFLSEALWWFSNGTRSYSTWADVGRYLPGFLTRSSSLTGRVCHPEFRLRHQGQLINLRAGESLAERQKADLILYSVPALLHYEDRNSMAHSIEAREPCLDYELCEFMLSCKPSLKLRQGWSKWILRQTLRDILPENIRLRRTKLGFDTPQAKWMRYDLREAIKSEIASSGLQMKRFLVAEKVLHEFTKFSGGHFGSTSDSALFRVLNLELWARTYKVS